MSKNWFRQLQRDQPALAEVYHRLCSLNVHIRMPCSEKDIEAVMSGNGHDVPDGQRIKELYWLCMNDIMSDHEHREFKKKGVGR
jgi:hypothetical protein